ncbi:hypothetical protein N657DRAFT_174035 [Parathielavia appendiculata]|uniref:Uncharacterized protein n=1 Tax=Parathielavia appendiculata TaxID=2587402 RepID=A0AAN6Z6T1_9PEZI|nr:hypothetical protein N657DRAFT_174035 [Parathielavia appendiculata]
MTGKLDTLPVKSTIFATLFCGLYSLAEYETARCHDSDLKQLARLDGHRFATRFHFPPRITYTRPNAVNDRRKKPKQKQTKHFK